VAAAALALAWLSFRFGSGPARVAGLAFGGLAFAQAALGVATVMQAAPLGLSLAHQGLGALLWLSAAASVRAAVAGAR